MRRHSALVPLSHDHQRGLVVARRMARAESETECSRVADDFVRFMVEEGSAHFREEEEVIFPLLAAFLDQPSELVDRALVEHGRLRAAAVRYGLGREPVDGEAVAAVGRLLEAHIRCEERELFPLVERTVPDEVLSEIGLAIRVPPSGRAQVGDLADPAGRRNSVGGRQRRPECDGGCMAAGRWGGFAPKRRARRAARRYRRRRHRHG